MKLPDCFRHGCSSYGVLFALVGLFATGLARAQDAGSAAGLKWKDAQAAFAAGDFTTAATKLESILKGTEVGAKVLAEKVTPSATPKQQWMEPVFFMMGAARYNAKDWPKAIAVFEKYRQLFPQSKRLSEIILSEAQADMFGGHAVDAIPLLTSLLGSPDLKPKAFMLLIEATKSANKPADAIALMEKERADPKIDPSFLQRINTVLLPLYLDADQEDKAFAVLQQMDANIGYVADSTVFNSLAIRLGDSLMKKKDIAGALNCYRRVRNNDQIISLQKAQIELLQHQHTLNAAAIQADPLNSQQIQADNRDIEKEIARDQDILVKYQTLPPVLPPLFLRLARVYSTAGSRWEAAVLYREVMRRWPKSAEAEGALYASIIEFDQLRRDERALALCQAYLTQYPQGQYLENVEFLRGALAYDQEDFDKASLYFTEALKNAKGTRREQIELNLGDIKMRTGKFDDAIASYRQYLKEYPQGAMVEQAEYRSALSLIFGGKADQATPAINSYLQKHPNGTYIADADYRLMVLKYAGQDYAGVLADAKTWQQKHGSAAPLAEVLSLIGDSYGSQGKDTDAIKAYIASYKVAHTTEVLNYSIFAAAKLLQKQGNWAAIRDMFQEFAKANPEHPTLVSALFWIGRADIKLGKAEEGRQFLADAAKKYLNDPSREPVDEIITQLATLFGRRHALPAPAAATPAASSATSAATNAAVTAVAPAPASDSAAITSTGDPVSDIVDALTVPNIETMPTAQARILFAKAELARIQRKPELEAQFLAQIAATRKPDELSPIILGQVGDYLLQAGKPDQATPFYSELLDTYEKSPVVDYAYNGLGAIAYAQKKYTLADKYYAKALDKGLGATKLKEITLGEAMTLLALNRPMEAKPLFEEVASNRTWRGEATAQSVYSLGDIQMTQGKFAEANAFYQRVFVAYQRYPAIQAKAYLKSGEAFEKLGQVPAAIKTYTEMLNNKNLAPFPEIADARDRLQHLSPK